MSIGSPSMPDVQMFWDDETTSGPSKQPNKSPVVVDDFPLNAPIPDNQVFIVRNCESRYLTHIFHKYAGKFIPHVPRWALHRFLPRASSAVVLDPFVGSGTSLVEALLDGQHGYGLDIDPLARLISKVKTTLIPPKCLRNLPKDVSRTLASLESGRFVPSIPTLNHWFSDAAVADLSAIYDVVEQYRREPDIYDFLLICFSSIIRRVSNADNQTMKTYVSHTHPKRPESARPLFLKTLSTYSDRLIKLSQMTRSSGMAHILRNGDAARIDLVWAEEGLPAVDLAITSPPYIKSVDYIYNQMAELFWIGDRWNLETQAKQNEFKKCYIGNDRSVGMLTPRPSQWPSDVGSYVSTISDKNLSAVANRYFLAMAQHFESVHRILKPGARYVMVVGDSTLGGIQVPTHSLLISSARQYGFRLGSQFAYEIRNKYMHFPRAGRGGVVLYDWVIELVRD